MKIRLFCVGKLKESYWREACAEYAKRLGAYCDFQIIEVNDVPCKEGASALEEKAVKDKEGKKILEKLSPSDYLIALDLNKLELDSPAFASFLDKSMTLSGANLSFVIGGSLGLSDELKKRANASISFGKMTFPHQLARVMLLEQLYRAFRILRGEPYHK